MSGQYNSTSRTLKDGDKSPLQLDASGNLKTAAGGTGSSADQVQGNVATDTADSGNPVKTGGVATTSPTTVTAGDRVDLWLTLQGATPVAGNTVTGSDGVSNSLVGLMTPSSSSGRALLVAPVAFNRVTGIWDRINGDSANGLVVQDAGAEYETVAASQTDQMLGASGAAGDFLRGLLIIPATTSPGEVSIEDGATNMIVFAGGASSVTELRPIWIPLGIKSVSGGWEVSTGANVSVLAAGNFT